MATFVSELVTSLDVRWQEVDLLLAEAKRESATKNLYDALCRSSVVFIVAHLEGFLKDTAKALVDDLNKFSTFKESPEVIKRTYCNQFSDSEKDSRIKRLIEVFDGLDTKFKVEPFLFDDNKNPAPTVVEKIAKNFGARDFFKSINRSRLDIIFTGTKSDVIPLVTDLDAVLDSGIKEFPYTVDLTGFGIGTGDGKPNEKSFWETFLDQLLLKRHGIAHGSSIENSLSIDEISEYKLKVQILQKAFILVLSQATVKRQEKTALQMSRPQPTQLV
jgi:hypothetical protein